MTSPRDATALLPGLAFVVALAVAAKGVYYATDAAVSAVLCAIGIGILWRNVIGLGTWAEHGVEFAGKTLLRIGIALIGLRLTLMVLADVSVVAIPIVLGCVSVALVTALGLGRLLGVPKGMRQLLAAGTAICGATAIISVAPLLRSKKADIGIALTSVVLFGSIAMMSYPWIAGALFGSAAVPAGMFFGSSIHDTSQVVGAAMIYAEQFQAPDTVAIAGLTKFLRTMGLLVLIPAAALLAARSEATAAGERPRGWYRKAVPLFVISFIGLVIVRTVGDGMAGDAAQWKALLGYAQTASEWLLLIGMAAVGLGVTVSHLREAGWRPIVLAFVAALLTGACGLVLVQALT
ncbi:MAG: YeiH family protein [Steroidobacteraceae bacterium]